MIRNDFWAFPPRRRLRRGARARYFAVYGHKVLIISLIAITLSLFLSRFGLSIMQLRRGDFFFLLRQQTFRLIQCHCWRKAFFACSVWWLREWIIGRPQWHCPNPFSWFWVVKERKWVTSPRVENGRHPGRTFDSWQGSLSAGMVGVAQVRMLATEGWRFFFVASFVFEELLHEGTCQPDLEAMDGFFSGAITFTYLENIRLLGGNAVHRVIGVKIGANALAGGHLLIIRKELVQILVK